MNDLPPYIADQAWSLLTEFARPQDFLHASQFRAGRPGIAMPAPSDSAAPDPWVEFDPAWLLAGSMELDGRQLDLSRVVITTDAGIGKTTATEYLEYAFGAVSPGLLAFRLTTRELCSSSGPLAQCSVGPKMNDALLSMLAGRFLDTIGEGGGDERRVQEAKQFVDWQRRRGNLVLVIDELDQPGGGIKPLKELVDSPFWRPARIILAGRPYSLQRHWKELLAGRGWVFVRLEEFDEPQQKRYLGTTPGGDERYDLVPEEARAIFGVPRVLSYLRALPPEQLGSIHTSADVYFRVILHLIQQGMEKSEQARLLGWEPEAPPPEPQYQNIRKARDLLAAIAYTLTCQQIRQQDVATGQIRLVANFDQIPSEECDCDFEEFEEQLVPRYKSRSGLGRDWQALAALNDILEHGLFDTNMGGLREIQFRNRSLQEFLCAWYLARNAEPEDAERLWDWIYLPENPETEQYYYVWQFLCEMPEDEHDGYCPEAWLTAIEPLYRPCYRRDEGVSDEGEADVSLSTGWDAKRSNEMIFRSFPRLSRLCEKGNSFAIEIRDRWWGEFEQIRAGKQGVARREAAKAFRNSFLRLPGGTFRMGSPPEKQGMPADVRAAWESQLAQWREGDREANVESFISSNFNYPPGRVGQRERDSLKRILVEAIESGVETFANRYYPADEEPVNKNQTVGPVWMARQPTLNSAYRLFVPRHGLGSSYFADTYKRISPDEQHPAIYTSFFDAWVFCRWARWGGECCRLPWENEWEFAAKFQVADWTQDYWWGGTFDSNRCNAAEIVGKTTPPSSAHGNPATQAPDIDPQGLGLMDMLGNVSEWCQDVYRQAYQRNDNDDPGPAGASRVLRGGSWFDVTHGCRCAYRNHDTPEGSGNRAGFRVCRGVISS